LHNWGFANQVTFDPGKESFHILHPRRYVGNNFHMLGVTFDPQLIMHTACYEIAAIASVRLRALLRTKRFHSTPTLVRQYKAQILSSIDFATPAIYHAPQFFLHVLDRIQDEFLAEMSLSPLAALCDYNLAPLSTRRDISMMGLLQRVSLGIAPAQFNHFIYAASPGAQSRGWAFTFLRHGRQLHDPIDGSTSRVMERSVLGLIYTYNCLPTHVVEHKTPKIFQRALQIGVKLCAHSGSSGWEALLKQGARAKGVTFFRKWFRDQPLGPAR
jgi:hypothetical protein